MARPATRAALAVAITSCALAVAACGSAVPPDQFVGAGQPPGTAAPAEGGGAAPAGYGAAPAGAGNAAPAGQAQPGGAAPPGGAGGPGGATAAGGGPPAAAGPAPSGRTAGPAGAPPSSPPSARPVVATAASCAGFTNGTGITDSAITIANASDVSGPVPGLFKSAQQATQAFAAYFNATSSVCGRTLRVQTLDSATSSGGDEQTATTACGSAFAMVGSMSAFDSGGAQTVAACGIPDVRAITVTPTRVASPVSFGTDAIDVSQVPTAPFDYLKQVGGDAYQHAAFLYLDAGAAAINAKSFQKAEEAMGYRFAYTQGVDVTTFNYAPYVAQMQSLGVKYVQWLGAYQNAVRLKQAMVQQGFNPIFAMDSVAYDKGFVTSGGPAVEGTYAFVDTALFEEGANNPELQLYQQWLQRVAPGATPSFFGLFAWGATRLFAQLAVQLGGRLNRQTLLAALRATHNYSGAGLFAPQDVGGKRTSRCQSVIQLRGGQWVRRTPYPYTCAGMVNSGVGG